VSEGSGRVMSPVLVAHGLLLNCVVAVGSVLSPVLVAHVPLLSGIC
jgi:hypothetical protein